MDRGAEARLRGCWVDVVDAILAPAATDEAWRGRSRPWGRRRSPARKWSSCTSSKISAHALPGVSAGITAIFEKPPHVLRRERRRLFQLGLHLDSAHRLRRRPRAVAAVLSDTGKLLHREPDAPTTERLVGHTQRVHHNGSTKSSDSDESSALDLWPALLDGRFSVVARKNGTRNEHVVLDNPPEARAFRTLSSREVAALRLASQGMSNKLVAYGLGVSQSAVTDHLTSAAAKIGVASRIELLSIAALVTGNECAGMSDALLGEAEVSILAMLERGFSNKAIAEARSRSVRTIANQVAALPRKTKASSPRELAVRASANAGGE